MIDETGKQQRTKMRGMSVIGLFLPVKPTRKLTVCSDQRAIHTTHRIELIKNSDAGRAYSRRRTYSMNGPLIYWLAFVLWSSKIGTTNITKINELLLLDSSYVVFPHPLGPMIAFTPGLKTPL